MLAAIAVSQTVPSEAGSVAGWKLVKHSFYRSTADYEYQKGPLVASVRIATHATPESAKGYEASVLTKTGIAQFPVENRVIEASGLRLFDTHVGQSRDDGKFVLSPTRGAILHGAVGSHSYMVGVRFSKPYPRDTMVKDLERFVPEMLKSAKPSTEVDSTVYPRSG